ncbi:MULTISPECIES: Uma2 family endonuclease [unclassified Microcoleus]|uniref:Uma2 family endonuclease n=1 Tax=unclassified Microcoleus TaxID=2642155 RepID=UPI002FD4A129
MDFEPFGSTTVKRKTMLQGIEPDECFYIQNYALMIGKKRIDLTVDPPPDLAIEVELTSQTQLDAYEALGVPEICRYENNKLLINVLQDGKYVEAEISPTFPNLPISEVISQYCEQSQTVGTSQTLRLFRKWVKEQIQN